MAWGWGPEFGASARLEWLALYWPGGTWAGRGSRVAVGAEAESDQENELILPLVSRFWPA